MEELEQLENEIKYFELLNGGLTALKFFQDGEQYDIKYILKQTTYLKNLKINFDESTFFMPYISAIASRQFITAFREQTESIDFSKIENSPSYIELKNELFGNYPDIPDDECNKILRNIANELAHGNVVKLFDFNKLTEFYSTLRHGKIPNIFAIAVLQKELFKLFTSFLSPEFNFVSRFEKLPNGQIKKLKQPKTISLNLDIKKMDRLIILADIARNRKNFSFNYDTNLNYDLFFDNEKLKQFIDEIEIKYGEEKIELDTVQKDDLFNIILHYVKKANNNRFDISQVFNVCLQRVLLYSVLRKKDLDRINSSLIKIVYATNPEELQKIILADCLNLELDDMETSSTLYSFEIENLYSELLITVVVNLLKQLENKKLYNELANTSFIAELTADIQEKDEATLTNKDKLKVIHTIRNALTHNRYINNANTTIDLYDEKQIDTEKHLKTSANQANKTLISKAIKTNAEKEIEFKFGLDIEDLEDIKDLCLQILIENYQKILSNSKKQ